MAATGHPGNVTLSTHTIGAGPRLVLAHGFTQNGHCWGRFAELLAKHFEVVLVDAPGHGESFHDDADLSEAGRLILEAGGDAHYLGYSMGGRMALHAALEPATPMRSLTLIGATGGLDDPAEQAARSVADEVLAERLLDDGLEAFLDFWLALPLFESLDRAAHQREHRLANREAGLAASLRACGTGTQDPLWDRLGEIDLSTLVIAGADDAKFSGLGRRLVANLPHGTFWSAPGGHALHSETPDAVAARVIDFIRSVEP